MYLKTIDEVEAALATRYSGETYKRVGQGGKEFTYIPWHVSVRLLNEIFGVFGWTSSTPLVVEAEGQWTVALSVTVRVMDRVGGAVVEKTVPGVGSAPARDDNSAKSAMSDALSKAVKFLGDAFGFYLSESGSEQNKTTSERPSSNGYGRGAGTGGAERKPFTGTIKDPDAPASDAQLGVLRRKGVTDDELAGLTKGQASAMIDSLNGSR